MYKSKDAHVDASDFVGVSVFEHVLDAVREWIDKRQKMQDTTHTRYKVRGTRCKVQGTTGACYDRGIPFFGENVF